MRLLITVLILLALAPFGWAQDNHYERLDALERQLEAANLGQDFDKFEQLFESLTAEYKRLNRPQEEAWTHINYGDASHGRALEDGLISSLKTEEAVALSRQEILNVLPHSDTGLHANLHFLRLKDSNILGIFRVSPNYIRFDQIVYEINRALGFTLVPVTTRRAWNGQFGSLQLVILDTVHGGRSFKESSYANEQLHMLDYLTWQLDRHRDNWLKRPGNQIVAIDNGSIRGSDYWNSQTPAAFETLPSAKPPKSISASNRVAILKLKRELEKPLSSRLDILTYEEKKFLLERINLLLQVPNCGDHLD